MDAAALARIDRESYISLSTKRRDGRMVDTPVWFAAHGGRLYVFTESKAGKVKRLRNFPQIRIAACDMRGKVHGPWLDGRGEQVKDPAQIETAYAALRNKYGWKMWVTDLFSRLSGRIGNRVVLALEL